MRRHRSTATTPLVALPSELQSIITSYISAACPVLVKPSKRFFPQLYETVELKVPLRWNRLASLERLLATSPEGLRYTRGLHIVTQQARMKDDQYGSLEDMHQTDDEEDEEDRLDDEDEVFKFYKPGRWASSALNTLIRLLILKLPRQQLCQFWWNHECSLATLTLAVLLNNHGASLHTLSFRSYTEQWKKSNLAGLAVDNSRTLNIAGLDVGGGTWPYRLLAKNYRTLRHLQLSNEISMASAYSEQGTLGPLPVRKRDTEVLMAEMQEKFSHLDESYIPVLRLDSLSVCGFDLHAITQGFPDPLIDFSSLGKLVLESCAGLSEAFLLLTGSNISRRDAIGSLNLHTFILRHEGVYDVFPRELEKFLVSLRPLSTLHVMLEGETDGDILGKVLKIHGKSLLSLIWDERLRPRTDILEDTSDLLAFENLRIIGKNCTQLKALGVPLDWEGLSECDRSHSKISANFSKLRHLQTLNIRNLPEASSVKTWLPNDYMLDGLALMLLNITNIRARPDSSPVLKTLAIGALTYGNVRMGVNHYPLYRFANFLQLRIYRVEYNGPAPGHRSPRLHLVAKGTPADAVGIAENLDIFETYWLDAAPQKSNSRPPYL